LCRRELLDSRFDLLDRAHGFTLRYGQNASNSQLFFVGLRGSRIQVKSFRNGHCFPSFRSVLIRMD
jgi:hypothetical protein